MDVTGPDAIDRDAIAARVARMEGLLTIRLASVFRLLQRSGAVANKRAFGLSTLEWWIMASVGKNAPISLMPLAETLGVDPGQLSRTVKGMVARGLLHRQRQPGGPTVVITLAEEGDRIHASMVERAVERDSFLVGDMARGDVDQLVMLLDALKGQAENLLERERATAAHGGPDPA